MKKRKIVISINPEYVENILNGSKKYEFRTRVAKDPINTLLIYETFPVKKIVAKAEIISVIKATPSELWETTKDSAGISKQNFDLYFKNRHVAYAYKLGKITKYAKPKSLSCYNIKSAPQSYVYVN